MADNQGDFWKRWADNVYMWLIGVVAILATIVAYVFIRLYEPKIEDSLLPWKTVFVLFGGLFTNIASAVIGYGLGYWFTRKKEAAEQIESGTSNIVLPIVSQLGKKLESLELIDPKTTTDMLNQILALARDDSLVQVLDDVDWKNLIEGSSEIDFFVQGWDGWVTRNQSSLETFFRNAGKFRLYVQHPTSTSAAPARQAMGLRLGNLPPDKMVAEIQNTVAQLRELISEVVESQTPRQQVGDSLQVWYMNRLNWYFGAKFTGPSKAGQPAARKVLIISPYAHKKSTIRNAPALMISLDAYPKINLWIESELRHLQSDDASERAEVNV
jgi:hypothetical protein